MLKFIILALLLFVTYKLFTGKGGKKEVKGKTEEEAVELVQDPINGVYVDKETEFKVKFYDTIYYFSSKENMEKFIQDRKG
jgi:YHS domain-containing protein